MEVIRRCYGCGKYIWPWQDAVDTKKVGRIHRTRDCVLDSWYKVLKAKGKPDSLYDEALFELNPKE